MRKFTKSLTILHFFFLVLSIWQWLVIENLGQITLWAPNSIDYCCNSYSRCQDLLHNSIKKRQKTHNISSTSKITPKLCIQDVSSNKSESCYTTQLNCDFYNSFHYLQCYVCCRQCFYYTLLLCSYQFSNSRKLTPSTNDNLICF